MTWLSSGREYSGNTAREEMRKAREPEKQWWVGVGFQKKKKLMPTPPKHPSSPKFPNQDPTNPAILCHPAREYAVTSFVTRGTSLS
jgi:hypothetical protein